MKRSRSSEEQIIGILKEHQAGGLFISCDQLCDNSERIHRSSFLRISGKLLRGSAKTGREGSQVNMEFGVVSIAVEAGHLQ